MALDLSKYGVSPATPALTSGASLDLSKYGVAPSAPVATPQATPSNSIWNALAGYAGGVKSAFQGGMGQTSEALQAIGAGTPGTNPIIGGIQQGLKAESGIASAISSPVAPLFAPVGAAIDAVGNAVGSIPAVQRFANSSAGQAASNIASTLADAGNVAGTITGIDQLVKGVPKIPGQLNKVASAFTPSPAETAQLAAQTAKSAALKAQDAIDTEVRNTAAKYPSVGKVLNYAEVSRKTDPISVLSSYEGGKALPELVKGKINVDTPVGFLKKQISTLSNIKSDLVKKTDTATPVADFKQAALERIDAQNWSIAKRTAEKAAVSKLVDGLQELYPKGIPSTEMDLLKSEHATESKSYRSQSPFSPDAHAIVGQAAAKIVETNGGEAPIHELNQLISSHYDAIKLLNAMRGKTPHGGAFTREAGRVGGEVLGLGAGMVIGHPFIGAMAGRAGADTISEIVNSHFISNPLKRTIVRNMKNADPEVVQKALDFINSQPGESTGSVGTESPPGGINPSSPNDTTPPAPQQPASPTPTAESSPSGNATTNIFKNIVTQGKQGFVKNPLAQNSEAAIPKELAPLAKEAAKYKSAEEFVRAKTNAVHGTDANFTVFDATKAGEKGAVYGKGTYLTTSAKEAAQHGKNVKSVYVDKSSILQADQLLTSAQITSLKRILGDYWDWNKPHTGDELYNRLQLTHKNPETILQKAGINGVEFTPIVKGGAKYKNIVAFNTKPLMTDSQLTDLYNSVKQTAKPAGLLNTIKTAGKRGFVKLPLKEKIPADDLATMSDFTDMLAGSYRPSASEAHNLEIAAKRLWTRYLGSEEKMPKTLQGIANDFGRALEASNFGKKQGRDVIGRFKNK